MGIVIHYIINQFNDIYIYTHQFYYMGYSDIPYMVP